MGNRHQEGDHEESQVGPGQYDTAKSTLKQGGQTIGERPLSPIDDDELGPGNRNSSY